MDFAPELALLYAEFGEPVTLAGSPITAIFEGGYAAALEVAGTQPTLRVRTADAPAIAAGASVARGAVNYLVRVVEPLGPDEQEKRLILERQ